MNKYLLHKVYQKSSYMSKFKDLLHKLVTKTIYYHKIEINKLFLKRHKIHTKY